jgi:two-component SAPR family response regulator
MTTRVSPGCRIFVVEDETLIAIQIEETLAEMGCAIIGPVGSLETALQLADATQFDAALLDVTIRGGRVYPVAEKLLAQGIPFVFASGYGDWSLPETLRHRPRLMKPFTADELKEKIR